MPKLIRNIIGEILDNHESSVKLSRTVVGQFGEEDYIEMGGFEAYLQDFRQISEVTDLTVPPNMGLKNKTEFITIEISY